MKRTQFEIRGGQLLGDAFAAHPHLLCRQARLLHGCARRLHPLLDGGALRLTLAQQRVQLIAGDSRGLQLALDLRADLKRVFELRLQRDERRFAVSELPRQLVAAQGKVLQLLLHARERVAQRGVR